MKMIHSFKINNEMRNITVKENKKPSALIVIFGATGDLANRKLFPSLYKLFEKGRLSARFAVVGVARRALTTEQFQEAVRTSIKADVSEDNSVVEFSSHFYYHSHDVTNSKSYTELRKMADELEDRKSVV